MTLVIDTVSEPGAWKRAIGRGCLANAEARCKACGATDCAHPDPIFAGIVPPLRERVFGRALAGGGSPAAGGFVHQVAGDRQTDNLGGMEERGGVHGLGSPTAGLAMS